MRQYDEAKWTKWTHKKHGRRNLDLRLRPEDGDEVGSGFFVGEANRAVGLRLDVVNEDTLLSEQRTMVSSWDGNRLINIILVLIDAVSDKQRPTNRVAFTFGFTSSITACLRLSRFMAFFAGVRAMTLSSLSLYPPIAANSSAFENLT